MKNTTALFLFIIGLWDNSVYASMLDIEKSINHCFTEASLQVNSSKECISLEEDKSRKDLQREISTMKAIIMEKYDDPFHLTEPDGDKINKIFIKQFDLSQQAWEEARNNLCEANANLMGEWAQSHDSSVMSCNIKMNIRRIEEIKLITRTAKN
ncbi:DUF1311 domain-containing protein [Winslowiella iniecta]|uniref:DUF1311 domain-containing protein n=1 Tax=Winslowiella iniecta TaxID=1560201 RepID=UPI00069FDABF|nr:DUF1311 domain-containing protein [Winslowiella iniecta]